MIDMSKLLVDFSSSVEDRKRALRVLRRNELYGRVARNALKSIEENGFYSGRIPLFAKHYNKPATIELSRVQDSKSVLPDLSQITVSVEMKERKSFIGGNPVRVGTVKINGPLFTRIGYGFVPSPGNTAEETARRIQEDSEDLGKVKITKGGATFEPYLRYNYNSGYSHRLYTKFDSEKSRMAMEQLSYGLACAITRRNQDKFSLSIRESMKQWLFEDKFCEKINNMILDQVKIIQVMEM